MAYKEHHHHLVTASSSTELYISSPRIFKHKIFPSMSEPSMDNKVAGPLRVPGFGDIPLEEEFPFSRRFTHGINEWKQDPAITQRELTMVAVMNELTDRPNWHMDVFDHDSGSMAGRNSWFDTPHKRKGMGVVRGRATRQRSLL